MSPYELDQLTWEDVTTATTFFQMARMRPALFSRKRRYAIKLAVGRVFCAERVEFDLTVELMVGTGVLAHNAAIPRIYAYQPGLTLLVHTGEALIFKSVNEETIFVVSYDPSRTPA